MRDALKNKKIQKNKIPQQYKKESKTYKKLIK